MQEISNQWGHYLAANPDLLQVGINTQAGACNHYWQCGKGEGRSVLFEWQHYLAANADLLTAGLKTEQDALRHFMGCGFKEARPNVFSWRNYAAANPDVPAAEKEALAHWICCGFHEGRSTVPTWDLRDPELTVVFVAHSMAIVEQLNRDYVNPHILFVGAQPFYETANPNVVLVRDLPDNIEAHWRLLTFTAWYAVAKNGLYADCGRLCLLEYDARVVSEAFIAEVKAAAQTHDVVGFSLNCGLFLNADVSADVMAAYIAAKGLDPAEYGPQFEWLCSTNLCAKRSFFADFVAWYDYAFIVEADDAHLPFYHERLAAVFTAGTGRTTKCVEGVVKHAELRSHGEGVH